MTSSNKNPNLFRQATLLSYALALGVTLALFSYLLTKPCTSILSLQRTPCPIKGGGAQSRQDVQKDIWIALSSSERTHNQLASKSSFLVLESNDGSLEIIERFQDIRGWVQERILQAGTYPMQQIRHFTAREGAYFYQKKNFTASDVSLAIYKIPINASIDNHKAFLQGTAEEISFSFQKESPLFQATRFKASLGSSQ